MEIRAYLINSRSFLTMRGKWGKILKLREHPRSGLQNTLGGAAKFKIFRTARVQKGQHKYIYILRERERE